MIKVITTTKYFGMSAEDLEEVKNDYGYTREDSKILDEGVDVTFFDRRGSIKEDEIQDYSKQTGLKLKAILRTTDNRYAVIFS